MFNVVIQLGAIFAVVILYFNKLNPFEGKKTRKEFLATIELWKKVIIGCIPAIVGGLLLNDFMDEYFNKAIVIATTLIVYGIAFIVIERRHKTVEPRIHSFEELDYVTAIKIGLFQTLALIPGTSRSGSTIIGGLLTGVSRKIAVEFSFFMGIPIMLGSSALKIVKYGFRYSSSEIMYLAVALVTTFIISMIVVRFLIDYLKKHDFQLFGWYRIILALVMICCFMIK